MHKDLPKMFLAESDPLLAVIDIYPMNFKMQYGRSQAAQRHCALRFKLLQLEV